jgi:hypothetical protein
VESEIAAARERKVGYGEFGGSVLGPELRASLAAWQIMILQRIGGRPLECDGVELPPYFDPNVNAIWRLRFDTAWAEFQIRSTSTEPDLGDAEGSSDLRRSDSKRGNRRVYVGCGVKTYIEINQRA